MPWSVNVGPFRYTPPRNNHQPAGLTVLLILGGLAAVALLLAVTVLYAAVVAGAWLAGLIVGVFRFDPVLWARRYATTVTDAVSSLWRNEHTFPDRDRKQETPPLSQSPRGEWFS